MAYGHTPLFPHAVGILSERQCQNHVVDQRLYHYTLCSADVFETPPSSDGLIAVSDVVDFQKRFIQRAKISSSPKYCHKLRLRKSTIYNVKGIINNGK